jgi:hypothetical protein
LAGLEIARVRADTGQSGEDSYERDFPRSFQHASGVLVDLDQSRGLDVKVSGGDVRYEVRERL